MPRLAYQISGGSARVRPYAERKDLPTTAFDRRLISIAGSILPRFSSTAALERKAEQIERLAQRLAFNSDELLRSKAEALRAELLRDGFSPQAVSHAFALIREVSGRKLGMRHHRVQLMGGLVMLKGRLAEMRTGEGKTITAMLPAATAALAGIPVHVITVNDYLSERDAEHLRSVYEALGLSLGLVRHDQDHAARRAAYECDITYCTNKDVAFDYLRDRITLGQCRSRSRLVVRQLTGAACQDQLLLRGLHFAIIDEADSVLIDEARTPLIISGSSHHVDSPELYADALRIAGALDRDQDFMVESSRSRVSLTPRGAEKLQRLACGRSGLWSSRRARNELAEQALAALHLYQRDKHYIVCDDKVQIVDEYTGRVMPDRSWERGLHQMIEMKEGCDTSGRRQTLARITYQRFFRRYLRLAGMTGTAAEARAELSAVYGLSAVRIRANRPPRSVDRGLRLFATAQMKWEAVIGSVRKTVGEGRPVLIGTRSVVASEHISALLKEAGLSHQVLNANQSQEEAEVIACAGEPGRITVATNMAGRGTDIRLAPVVAKKGGLHVILTEFHESPRVDRQLFGRCGRQGDQGSFEAIISLEDEIFERFAKGATRFLRRWIGSNGELPRAMGPVLRCIAQGAAEREHEKVRHDTMRLDGELEKLLAFAGCAE